MGAVLIVVGGFLLGGAYSVWRQSREPDPPVPGRRRPTPGRNADSDRATARQAHQRLVIAVALLVLAVLAILAGVLRLV